MYLLRKIFFFLFFSGKRTFLCIKLKIISIASKRFPFYDGRVGRNRKQFGKFSGLVYRYLNSQIIETTHGTLKTINMQNLIFLTEISAYF